MNKTMIMEVLLPYVEIKDVRDIISKLNNENKKYDILVLLNKFFKVKITFKDNREEVYDHLTFYGCSESKVIGKDEDNNDIKVPKEKIVDFDIITSSSVLFNSIKELSRICDSNLITEKGIEYAWNIYLNKTLDTIKNYSYVYLIKLPKDITDYLMRNNVRDIKERVVIGNYEIDNKDDFIFVKKTRYGSFLGIVLNSKFLLNIVSW